MRHFIAFICAAILGVFGWMAAAADSGTAQPAALRPLTIDKSAPLLLDEPALNRPAADTPPTLTRSLICHDCHGDFLRDSFSVTHGTNRVTCVSCHGLSEAHSGDEENITPPQIMYAREAIAVKCRECHEGHNAAADAVIALWQQRGLQKLKPAQLVCTDCHGTHRMKVRMVRWDKKTGKIQP